MIFPRFNWRQWFRWFFINLGFCCWWFVWVNCFQWVSVRRWRRCLRVGFLRLRVPFLGGYFPFQVRWGWVLVFRRMRATCLQNGVGVKWFSLHRQFRTVRTTFWVFRWPESMGLIGNETGSFGGVVEHWVCFRLLPFFSSEDRSFYSYFYVKVYVYVYLFVW